jgi:hypothetical protein
MESWSGSVEGEVTRGYDPHLRISSIGLNGDDRTYPYDSDGLLKGAGNLVLVRNPKSGFLTESVLDSTHVRNSWNAFGELMAILGGNNMPSVPVEVSISNPLVNDPNVAMEAELPGAGGVSVNGRELV